MIKLTRTEREKKANEVKLNIAILDINHLTEIKKLKIILDLWVKYGREHHEIMNVPIADKKLEIQLYTYTKPVSFVVLKNDYE
jgi:hypothetical protein